MSGNDASWRELALRLCRQLDQTEEALREAKAKSRKQRAQIDAARQRWESIQNTALGKLAIKFAKEPQKPGASEAIALPDPEPVALSLPDAPEISVVIPVHNQVRFTAQCLKSLSETPSKHPFEVIVVDDGSTDGTAAYLAACRGIRVERRDPNAGFIAACNHGARAARGQWLVFLNNDTVVTGGWLDHLRDTFVRYPDAGLAGVRLVYPDGKLQEAGGRIFCDGSAANIGHGASPDDPEFNFVREVDYCSAAGVMIPKEVFVQVGEFDSHYAPCYYEDVDLAFKVRAAGKRILFQPAAKVIHFEGGTAGRDTSSGPKQYQRANRLKFFERWIADLASRPAKGVSHQNRRVLVVDDRLPGETDAGAYRLQWLLKLLQEIGLEVSFMTGKLLDAPELRQQGIQVITSGPWKKAEEFLAERAARYDFAILCRLKNAKRFLPLIRENAPKTQVIFDTVDLHFLREQREAELRADPDAMQAALETKQIEMGLMKQSSQTWVVSHFEKELLASEAPGLRVETVPLIQPVTGCAAPFEARRDWLFIGGFRHKPNVDAMEWYLREVQPIVESRLPDARCYILGSDPPDSLRALASDRVEIAGFVPDVDPWLSKVRFTIVPLRFGAGVKGKVNLSLGSGVPVIGTPVAFEGTGLEPDRDVLVADTAEAFAARMIALYDDAELWKLLSDSGMATICRTISPEVIRETLKPLFNDVR